MASMLTFIADNFEKKQLLDDITDIFKMYDELPSIAIDYYCNVIYENVKPSLKIN